MDNTMDITTALTTAFTTDTNAATEELATPHPVWRATMNIARPKQNGDKTLILSPFA